MTKIFIILTAFIITNNFSAFATEEFLDFDRRKAGEPLITSSVSVTLTVNQIPSPLEKSSSKRKRDNLADGFSGPQWGVPQEEISYLFERSHNFVCIIEFGGYLRRVNSVWSTVLGWTAEELLKTPYINFVHSKDVEKTLTYEKAFNPEGLINRYRCKDGSYRWLDWIGMPQVRERDGERRGFPLTIARDITLQKTLEIERGRKLAEKQQQRHRDKEVLRLKKEEKEKVISIATTKSSFVAHMSHEIRTPLTGIIGLLDLVDKSKLSTVDRDYIETAEGSAQSLLTIANDILDMTKLEAGILQLEEKEFNLLTTVQRVVQTLGVEAKKKGIEITLSVKPIPLIVIGDETRLTQILFNLVSNSLKFTEKGSVEIGLNGISGLSNFTLMGSVKDTGIGMKPEVVGRLFTPFSQGDNSLMRQFGGTGLGLFITKQLCKKMGGSISAKTKIGKGSLFDFRINLRLPTAPKLESKKDKVGTGPSYKLSPNLRVLIVEDNLINQKVLKAMLVRSGCSHIDTALNGVEALKEVSLNKYDLILMDGEMPEMDGLEATREIRKVPEKQSLPIIGVTAHALSTHRDKFLSSGMNGFLTKPVKQAELITEILRCLKIS